jgi:hypothetical protein
MRHQPPVQFAGPARPTGRATRNRRGLESWHVALVPLLFLALAACGGDPVAAAAGTYHLDLHDLVAGGLEGADADARNRALQQVQGSHATLQLDGDGTWAVTGTVGGKELDDGGRWSLEGEVLILDYERELGMPNHRRVRGTCADGVVTFKPVPHMPRPNRYVRQP